MLCARLSVRLLLASIADAGNALFASNLTGSQRLTPIYGDELPTVNGPPNLLQTKLWRWWDLRCPAEIGLGIHTPDLVAHLFAKSFGLGCLSAQRAAFLVRSSARSLFHACVTPITRPYVSLFATSPEHVRPCPPGDSTRSTVGRSPDFDDPQLGTLVETALTSSTKVQMAVARVDNPQRNPKARSSLLLWKVCRDQVAALKIFSGVERVPLGLQQLASHVERFHAPRKFLTPATATAWGRSRRDYFCCLTGLNAQRDLFNARTAVVDERNRNVNQIRPQQTFGSRQADADRLP